MVQGVEQAWNDDWTAGQSGGRQPSDRPVLRTARVGRTDAPEGVRVSNLRGGSAPTASIRPARPATWLHAQGDCRALEPARQLHGTVRNRPGQGADQARAGAAQSP